MLISIAIVQFDNYVEVMKSKVNYKNVFCHDIKSIPYVVFAFSYDTSR